jgi:hypothetical protein
VNARSRHNQLRAQLQATIDRFDSIPEAELETRSEYARFLLVRVSGFLEYALERVLTEYVQDHSGGPVKSFALSFAGYVGNPTSQRLCDFMGRFDQTWRTELETFLNDGERKTSLNSLVGLRNKVAHGEPSSVSYTTLMSYLRVVDEFFDWLLDRLEPRPPTG